MSDRGTSGSIRIGTVRLRVPGRSAEAGRAFAREFTDTLATHADAVVPSHVGALHVRVGGRDGPARAAVRVAARLRGSRSPHA